MSSSSAGKPAPARSAPALRGGYTSFMNGKVCRGRRFGYFYVFGPFGILVFALLYLFWAFALSVFALVFSCSVLGSLYLSPCVFVSLRT